MKKWMDVINEVTSENRLEVEIASGLSALPSPARVSAVCHTMDGDVLQLDQKRYYLSQSDDELYFTQREAQCMYYILHGCTIVQVGERLNLSHRTVEFYVKNMKMKLNIQTKSELIAYAMKIGFLELIDFSDSTDRLFSD
tara:strand:- start:1586 stop:2005 length:420 start_codon:yes stop_codon:yes gene_type:complete